LIGFDREYEKAGEWFVHSECLAVTPQVESERGLSIRQIRGAPPYIACWVCGAVRSINDDCFVSRCTECSDSAYEYDVPPPDFEFIEEVANYWKN
jgi:hypothetical protein